MSYRRRAVLAACLAAAAVLAMQGATARADELKGVFRSDATRQALEYKFTADDARLLDEVQRGCFNYLWNEVGWPSGFAKDRRTASVASLAGVGFQLSALPIAVERGWISRAQGE